MKIHSLRQKPFVIGVLLLFGVLVYLTFNNIKLSQANTKLALENKQYKDKAWNKTLSSLTRGQLQLGNAVELTSGAKFILYDVDTFKSRSRKDPWCPWKDELLITLDIGIEAPNQENLANVIKSLPTNAGILIFDGTGDILDERPVRITNVGILLDSILNEIRQPDLLTAYNEEITRKNEANYQNKEYSLPLKMRGWITFLLANNSFWPFSDKIATAKEGKIPPFTTFYYDGIESNLYALKLDKQTKKDIFSINSCADGKQSINTDGAVEIVKELPEVKSYLLESSVGSISPIVSVDNKDELNDSSWSVHVWQGAKDNKSFTTTFNWYTIDKCTGSIKCSFNKYDKQGNLTGASSESEYPCK